MRRVYSSFGFLSCLAAKARRGNALGRDAARDRRPHPPGEVRSFPGVAGTFKQQVSRLSPCGFAQHSVHSDCRHFVSAGVQGKSIAKSPDLGAHGSDLVDEEVCSGAFESVCASSGILAEIGAGRSDACPSLSLERPLSRTNRHARMIDINQIPRRAKPGTLKRRLRSFGIPP